MKFSFTMLAILLATVLSTSLVAQDKKKGGAMMQAPEAMMQAPEAMMEAKDSMMAEFKGHDESTMEGMVEDLGVAPELTAKGPWINSKERTLNELRGKVTLVSFWTYTCPVCAATITNLKPLYNKYKKLGFEIIGVHAPESEAAKTLKNVQSNVKRLKIDWPVVLDNDFSQSKSFGGAVMPSLYFIDAKGNIRHVRHGGGAKTADIEKVLVQLMAEAGLTKAMKK